MCGICGFTGELLNRDRVLKDMADKIIHRGPDSCGYFSNPEISMGFRRLSIIDLEAGDQPIFNEDKTLVLTFNGEIYNYKELREELQRKGHIFATHTDSEVLIHGFEEWREGLLNRLRGMFGFAIWNTVDKSLFIARDFFGIKPMHYTKVGDHLVYGSEIKSILQFPGFEKKFNYDTLNNYLSFQYAVPPQTFFENLYCLLPGHYLWYKNGKITTTRYWEAMFEPQNDMTEAQAVDKIEKVFANSVDTHKISDVEVGCFLSSGVDSSYVAAIADVDKTFTVGFGTEERYNEIGWAKGFSEAIGKKNYNKVISPEEYWEKLPMIQYHMDEPLADPAAIALYFVCNLASQSLKVVLSGEGADEIFGGYNVYSEPGGSAYDKLPRGLRRGIGHIAEKMPAHRGRNFLVRKGKDLEERFIGNAYMFTPEERKALLKIRTNAPDPMAITKPFYDKVQDQDDVTKMQYLDLHMWMAGDILLKADKMSMANSLELRVPFLDKKVMELAEQIPTRYRVTREAVTDEKTPYITKYAMRLAAKKDTPPQTAKTAAKKKLGFPVPIRVWLKEDKYYSIVRERFESDEANRFFHTEKLVRLLDDHRAGKADNSRKIWTLYMFLVWYQIYFPEACGA